MKGKEMSDNQLVELIERYLNGDMSQEEREQFELLRKENADVESQLKAHRNFTVLIKQYGERLDLENRLNAIHDEIDVHTLKEELMIHPSWIVQLWRHHHSKISVAASIAIFAILSTMFLTGNLSNRDSKYIELRREVVGLKRSNENLNKSIKNLPQNIKSGRGVNADKYRGTGFAISSNGVIMTNYHVIYGADSVYVQNSAGKAFKAEIIYTEPQNDLAVLKIIDSTFKNLGAIPYTIKRSESDLAESVYTLGYPGDSPVLGPGYLTSTTGLNGDSLDYQVSIPINPGNSGGPLMDYKGNVIGIVKAKQTQIEGAHFAVKSSYLLNAIQSIPTDSLSRKITLNGKNTLSGLSLTQQVKKMKNYVFMVKVYN